MAEALRLALLWNHSAFKWPSHLPQFIKEQVRGIVKDCTDLVHRPPLWYSLQTVQFQSDNRFCLPHHLVQFVGLDAFFPAHMLFTEVVPLCTLWTVTDFGSFNFRWLKRIFMEAASLTSHTLLLILSACPNIVSSKIMDLYSKLHENNDNLWHYT